ncbi:MAG: hypothetical protein K0R47_394 [Brevibacillus sp.]|nr:hypothetical protein [Brevibacillus sp.]
MKLTDLRLEESSMEVGNRMNTAKEYKRWLMTICACLLLVAAMPGGWATIARAEAAIQLGVTAGVGGEYKETGMVPVQVTVTNNGPDVEGDIAVATGDRGNNTFSVSYYQPISIAKGATKQITITVPGSEVRPDSYVALMKNDEILVKAPVGGRRYNSDTLLIGVLAEDPDTANFLGVLPKASFSNEVKVLPMKPDQVPTAGAQLRMIDLLVLNNFALDTLNAQQIQAIRDWTKSGGMLIMAGGAQYKKTADVLADLSPVEVSGETQVQSLASLAIDKNKAVELNAPFTISTGKVKAGKAWYIEGNQPLFASRTVGEGKVLYVAYDLAAEPLASWTGNSKLWADTLIKSFGSTLDRNRDSLTDSIWPLSEAADRIPALKIPEVGWFALFFGIYALIAGPILFYLLRYKRKQSYMWAIVPVLSVVTGVGIFSFGAMQRGMGVLVHQTGYVEMSGDGQAKAKGVTAFFVPTSGDYKVTIAGQGLSQPIIESRRFDEIPRIWASLQPDHTDIQFRDVEFWSMRKVATEQTVTDAGTFVSDLSYADGALTGTVTNKSKYALKSVKVVSGMQVQEFPEMAPGDTVQVKLSFQPDSQMQSRKGQNQRLSGLLVPNHASANPYENTREQVMAQIVEFRRGGSSQAAQVMIAGWANEPIVDASIKGETIHPDSLSLVTSPLQIKPAKDGRVYYPAGTFDVTMAGSSVSVDDLGDGFMMPAGDISFDVNLNQDGQKLQISNLYLYTWSDDNTPFDKQVYNWKTKAFEPYDKAFVNNKMTGDKAAAYISGDSVVRLKFSHQFPDHRHIGIPSVSVEGKVTNP